MIVAIVMGLVAIALAGVNAWQLSKPAQPPTAQQRVFVAVLVWPLPDGAKIVVGAPVPVFGEVHVLGRAVPASPGQAELLTDKFELPPDANWVNYPTGVPFVVPKNGFGLELDATTQLLGPSTAGLWNGEATRPLEAVALS